MDNFKITMKVIVIYHCALATKHASQGIYPGFETQFQKHQKSLTGYQWPHKKG